VVSEVSQPLASLPSQLPKPALQPPRPHTPARHAAVPLAGDAQRIPHAPQCKALSVVLVSQPLVSLPSQLPKPATHAPTAQRPPVHAGVALGRLHCVPHAPQFEALVWVLTHALPQHISPAGHPRPGPQPMTHAPSRQSWPMGQWSSCAHCAQVCVAVLQRIGAAPPSTPIAPIHPRSLRQPWAQARVVGEQYWPSGHGSFAGSQPASAGGVSGVTEGPSVGM